MPVGGVVATADMPAAQADSQMQPFAARAQAILAAVDRRGQLAEADLVQVATDDRVQRAP